MDLEKRLNYLKEVSAFVRITEEPRHIGCNMVCVYGMIEDNILSHYDVSLNQLQKDYTMRRFQYAGYSPMQLNMDLGYQENTIIGEIK